MYSIIKSASMVTRQDSMARSIKRECALKAIGIYLCHQDTVKPFARASAVNDLGC